ncbi:MAG: hypothetical protein LBR43_03515 [Spiroplasmataceae bacterium]|jgi:hypothetical protein|nr:hypothetical protein [Spiroplasmataceae bacterium]
MNPNEQIEHLKTELNNTSNDVDLKPLLGGWYQLGIAIRSLEHKYCPDKDDE